MRGGEVSYSDADSGVYARNHEFNGSYTPPHNSCYMIFGSYVEHAVAGMVSGKRIVVVMMFKINVSFKKLIYMWGTKPGRVQCPHCYLLYDNDDSLRKHNCGHVVLYSRFKDGKYIFDESKKKDEEKMFE